MNTLSLKSYVIPSNIEKMCCMIKDILKDIQADCRNISEDTLFELKVILNELFLNAIKHGNKMNELKKLKVELGFTTDRRIFFVIQDEGDGFDYNFVHSSTIDMDINSCCDLKETGRGVQIVQNMCDRITYNEKGNKVVVIKSI